MRVVTAVPLAGTPYLAPLSPGQGWLASTENRQHTHSHSPTRSLTYPLSHWLTE